MSSATYWGLTSGPAEPAAIGTVMPPAAHTAMALRVTFPSVWLPATVVIASRSMSGFPAARRMAIASSCPGSQSRMIFSTTYEPMAPPVVALGLRGRVRRQVDGLLG